MKTSAMLSLCILLGATHAQAESSRTTAQGLFKKFNQAVISIEVVFNVNITYKGQQIPSREQKLEVVGTVLDENGLTVVSNSQVDVAALISRRKTPGMQASADVTAVKLIMPDGTELEADMVLKEVDLDLVFIKPRTKPEGGFTYISFAKTAVPSLLDEVVVVSRLGKNAKRSGSLHLGEVNAIMRKPRTMLILNGEISGKVGSPAFNLAGEPLGLLVIRNNRLPVVLSSEDLLEYIEQAQEAKAEKPKAADVPDVDPLDAEFE